MIFSYIKMNFQFSHFFKDLLKIEAFHADFFGPKTSLDFPILAQALKYLNWSCYMSHTFAYTSQKAKVYLLSSSNYRSKIWQFSKPSTEHYPCRVAIVELSPVRFFMQLLQFLALIVLL